MDPLHQAGGEISTAAAAAQNAIARPADENPPASASSGIMDDAELVREEAAVQRREAEVQKRRKMNDLVMREKAAHLRDSALRRDEEVLERKKNLKRGRLDAKIRKDLLDLEEREAKLERRKHDLKIQSARRDSIDKDVNGWYKRQLYTAMALVTGLTVLFQIQSKLPSELRVLVLVVFVCVWQLGALAFVVGLDGPRSWEKYSRRVGLFIFFCFSLFVLYAVYLGHDAPSRDSSWLFLPYIIYGVIVFLAHLVFWLHGYLNSTR